MSATSGFDHMDTNLKKERGLTFCNIPNANVRSAAELTIFHILSFLKKGPHLLSKDWEWRDKNVLGTEISRKTVALIGLGRIGQSVAKVLKAFDCDIVAYDPYLSEDIFKEHDIKSVSLTEALKLADILSLHCPLTKKTKHIINEDSFKHMKPTALLINCARGSLVCQKDLIKVLEQNKIQGACLDVFEEEPLIKNTPLRTLTNAQVSPHIGGYTVEAHDKSALEAAHQVKAWLENTSTQLNSVPPNTKWAQEDL